MKKLLATLLAGMCLAIYVTPSAAQRTLRKNKNRSVETIPQMLDRLRICPKGRELSTLYVTLVTALPASPEVQETAQKCFRAEAIQHRDNMRRLFKLGRLKERSAEALLFDNAAQFIDGDNILFPSFDLTSEELTVITAAVRVAEGTEDLPATPPKRSKFAVTLARRSRQ